LYKTDWITLGMDPSNLENCMYADGDKKYISMEGMPYQDPVHRAGYLIRRVQDFPTSLLEPSNQVQGDGLGSAFEPLAPPSTQVTLSWVRKLQRIEVALQNKTRMPYMWA
jgi:hypothetical protein